MMYSAKPGLLIAFHGCDKSLRVKIIKGTTSLNCSKNNYDWLGNGIYFWENNYQKDLEFAKALKRNPGDGNIIKIPVVVGAVIDLAFCLDLLDTEYLKLVTES